MKENKHVFYFRVVFALFFFCNLTLWAKSSSAAVPFGTLVALVSLWLGISIPLTFFGSYFGFKKRVKFKIKNLKKIKIKIFF